MKISAIRKMSKYFVIFVPVILYLAALNPYISTSTYDNTDYYEGIKHFVRTGSYLVKEGYPTGWAPGLPLFLSIPGWLGFSSLWLIKGGITLSAILSVFLLYNFFSIEKRSHRNLTLFVFFISPLALQLSTKIMAEWPFLMWSMAFFVCFNMMIKRKSPIILYSVLAAFFLIIAILTRYIGILLVVPVFVHMLVRWYESKDSFHLKTIIPELCLILISFSCYFSWKIYLNHLLVSKNVWVSLDYSQTLSNFYYWSFFKTTYQFLVQLLHIHLLFSNESAMANVLCIVVAVIMITGFASMVRNKRINPTDFYALATIIVLLFYKHKLSRYIFPISPFLINYFFEGVHCIFKNSVLRSEFHQRLLSRGIVFLWISFFLMINLTLLTFGNLSTHNGLNYFVSPTPERFYKGNALDLYNASTAIKNAEIAGTIYSRTDSFADYQYVRIFSDREISREIDKEVQFLLIQQDVEPSISLENIRKFNLIKAFGKYNIYQRALLN